MASNPLFIIPDFFLHFHNELCYGYLGFEDNGHLPKGIFPFQLQTKGSHIFKFAMKMQNKSGIMKSGFDAMPLFLLDNLLRKIPAY